MKPQGPVQTIPPGLLSLFQLKSLGVTPDLMDGQYTLSVEMFEWLMQARMIDAGAGSTGNVANGATGFKPITQYLVPSSQWWWVDTFTVYTDPRLAAATEVSSIAPAVQPNPAIATAFYLLAAPSPIITGTANTRYVMNTARGFWVPPGAQLGVFVAANDTAANISYSANLRFCTLQS